MSGSHDDTDVKKTSETPYSEHFRNFALGVAAICVPLVGYIYTDQENSRQIKAGIDSNTRQIEAARELARAQAQEAGAEKDRDLSKSYVELAVGILKQKGTGQFDPVRDWAVRLINRNTDVKLNQLAQISLVGESLNDTHGYDLAYYEVGLDGRVTRDGQLEVVPHQNPMPDFLTIKKGSFLQAASDIHLRTATHLIGSEIHEGQCVQTTSDADPSLAVAVKKAKSGGYLTVRMAPCSGVSRR